MTEQAPIRLVTARETAVGESVESVVKQLETWLEMARKGEVHSVAVAAVYDNGRIGCGFSKAPSYGLMLASILDMQHTYMKEHEL